MILVKSVKIFHLLFLCEISLKYMFGDCSRLKKQAFVDYGNISFTQLQN